MSYDVTLHPFYPAPPTWTYFYKLFALVTQASKTATGSGTAVDTNVKPAQCFAVLNALNTAGATPTLDVIIEESADGGSTWTQIAAFAQVTTVAGMQIISFKKTQSKVRASWTIGGTSSPAYTISVNLGE